jgi:hypothetical protein
MTEHPMQPPPELFSEWYAEACLEIKPTKESGRIAGRVARTAYAAGADAELEACVEWLEQNQGRWEIPASLRAARRPKPPSLKQQACDALDAYVYGNPDHGDKQNTYNAIRRALEQLPDD